MRRPRLSPSHVAHRGYTAVEVLLAMTVLAIGAAGVMSMQKSAIQGNLDARKLDLANSISHEWTERLRKDATQWTLPSDAVLGINNFGNTQWLSPAYAASGGRCTTNYWLPPIPTGAYPVDGKSPAFDILGRDLNATDAPNAVFCTHICVENLLTDQTTGFPILLRASVLVFWLKQLVISQPPAAGAGICSIADVAADEAAKPGTWHMVYAVTAIRKNPIQ
jgi:prepilin-type N-terminal cleavage/methylation domain-containing protein